MRTLTVLCLILAGCGIRTQYSATRSAPTPLAPRPPATVEVFATDIPDHPYLEIGTIEGRSNKVESIGDLIAALRRKAAKIGCDGLIVAGPHDRVSSHSSTKVTGQGKGSRVESSGWTQTESGLWGVCVVFERTAVAR